MISTSPMRQCIFFRRSATDMSMTRSKQQDFHFPDVAKQFFPIAVVGEGMHPCGLRSGTSIVNELKTSSISNKKQHTMSNLVRLVTHNRISYFENPTIEEAKALGAPGELLFDAMCNKQLALFIEKAMQVQVLYRE